MTLPHTYDPSADPLTAWRMVVSADDAEMLHEHLSRMDPAAAKRLLNTPPMDIEYADKSGRSQMPTLLGIAANCNAYRAGEVLIAFGADPNAFVSTKEYQQTALHAAERMGFTEFTDMLRSNGAREDIRDFAGKKPIEVRNDPICEESRRQYRLHETTIKEAWKTTRTVNKGRGYPDRLPCNF